MNEWNNVLGPGGSPKPYPEQRAKEWGINPDNLNVEYGGPKDTSLLLVKILIALGDEYGSLRVARAALNLMEETND